MLMSKLVSICVYFRRCIMTHRIPDIRLIDNLRVQEFVLKLEEWDKEEGTTTNSSIKISDFKSDQWNFTTFNNKLVTLLLSTYRCRNCTLEYIIRTNKEPLFGPLIEEVSPNVSFPKVLSNRVTLFGTDFQSDNKTLFSILRTYLTDTASWNLISSFSQAQNQRAAYRALCSHYQGSTYFDLLKTKENTMMTTLFIEESSTNLTSINTSIFTSRLIGIMSKPNLEPSPSQWRFYTSKEEFGAKLAWRQALSLPGDFPTWIQASQPSQTISLKD